MSTPSDAPQDTTAEEHRLHPLSIPFWLGGQIRRAVLPIVFGAASAGAFGVSWEAIVLLGLIPLALGAVTRFLTFRYRYAPGELVVRSGLLFRRERHIPYARIQNLDAVTGVLHRAFGVAEVRLQTGGGDEPEAKLTVLPASAVTELRRRVFEGRDFDVDELAGREPGVGEPGVGEPGVREPGVREPGTPESDDRVPAPAEGRLLLHLPPRELVLYGLIQNRGMIVIGAALGVIWETGLTDRVAPTVFGEGSGARRVLDDLLGETLGGAGLGSGILTVVLFIATLLVVARVLSAGWALVRLHDYRVTRVGEDLRTTYGLLTRVTATIPVRRVQTVTIHQGPLHRLANRVAVRVETAGGVKTEEGSAEPPWLAPLLPRGRLTALLGSVVPELDFETVDWKPVAPGAVRRVLKESSAVAVLVSVPAFVALGTAWGLATLGGLVGLAIVYSRQHVRHLGWSVEDGTVVFRTGWLWRRVSVARFAKIQAVTVKESPFDRRRWMARLRTDTAGARGGHGVYIPYLPKETAFRVAERLAAEAARTEFRW